jgi:hypothetical protein
MPDEVQKTLRYHVVAGARDILVVSGVISILASALYFTLRPYIEPFANLPTELASVQLELAETRRDLSTINASLRSVQEYNVVEFDGPGIVQTGTPKLAGQVINILYYLRRNANCSTRLEPRFYNVETNTYIVDAPRFAIRAPTTEEFTLFTVPVPLPEDIPPGRYVYAPLIEALDCGVYGTQGVPPSTIFEISSSGVNE